MRLAIRPARSRSPEWRQDIDEPDDRSFIVGSWVSSFKHRPPLVSIGEWHGVMSLAVTRFVDRPEVKVIVAADADAEPGVGDLLGWMAYEHNAVDRVPVEKGGRQQWEYRRAPPDERDRSMEPLIWYAYTKAPFRKLGIARRLFRHAGIDPAGRFHYAFETYIVGQLMAARKLPRATLRPGLGRIDDRRDHGQPRPAEDEHAA